MGTIKHEPGVRNELGNGNRNSSNGLIMNVNNTEAVLAQGTLSEGPGRGSPSIGGNVHNGLTCPRW